MSKPSVDAKTRKKRAQRRGVWAEWLTRQYLRITGWRILAKNFKSPVGEIDVIARKGAVISYVEVKTRTDAHALPHAVSAHQTERIQRAADYFLLKNPALQTCDVRFDVALVRGPLHIEFIRDAWQVNMRP